MSHIVLSKLAAAVLVLSVGTAQAQAPQGAARSGEGEGGLAEATGVCPQQRDTTERQRAILADIRGATNEMEARRLTNGLWEIWASAPDARAQRLLDEGMERRAMADLDAATSAFDRLVAYCPDYAEGYNQRAFVAFIRGDYATALEDLERAVARAPLHVAARSGMALSLMGLGRILAARGVMREALDLHPWLPERHLLPVEGSANPEIEL